jgi:hypothetical protein
MLGGMRGDPMRLRSITTATGQHLELGRFVVLVGPHNSGKSQSLRDIRDLIVRGTEAQSVAKVIKSVVFEKPPTYEDMVQGIDLREIPGYPAQVTARSLGSNFSGQESTTLDQHGLRHLYDHFEESPTGLQNSGLGRFRVFFLDTATRLTLGQSCASHNPSNQAPSTPLQALFAAGAGAEAELRAIFNRTFDMDIKLDWIQMIGLSLRIARRFPEIPLDPREAWPIMQQFPLIEAQGDGFRSFVGVALGLLFSAGRIALVDEPEAFLHPSHARRLGGWIAERMRDSSDQIIVTTHSADILAGILARTQDLTILRVNRADDQTTYVPMPVELTARLATHPVLSSQRVHESLFYRGVVVCEGDADRSVYEAVAIQAHDDRDVLFINAHNKQTIWAIVDLLRQARVPVGCIVDFDILNSHEELQRLFQAASPGADYRDILEMRRRLGEVIAGRTEADVLREVSGLVDALQGRLRAGLDLTGAQAAINDLARADSKWGPAKRNGLNALDGEARSLGAELIDRAARIGIFIVPVGDLEAWADVGVRQKNLYVTRVLEVIASRRCPKPLAEFVRRTLQFLRN